jgi:dienelactone hydrolase
MRFRSILSSAVLAALVVPTCLLAGPADAASEPASCEVGIYGFAESFVAITRRSDGHRYSFSDGRTGRVTPDGPVTCTEAGVEIAGAQVWPPRPIIVTDTAFEVEGVMLGGQLLQPSGAGPETPLVVLAHGSEATGWIEAVSYPYQLVGRGVSVFVYDKRGGGRSHGEYTQNFPQLANDLVAASVEARRLADGQFGRFGLMGFSQGGWIAPLAAERAGAEFLAIGYGLATGILEEDAAQVELELTEAGHSESILAAGRRITDVTARLAVSGYTDGLDDLARLQAEYGDQVWFREIRGGFTGVLLGLSVDELRENGVPMFDRLNIDWSIDPVEVLASVDVPQLWVLAQNDREAPVARTLERLQQLRADGQDISIIMFPDTDHGMWEFEQAPDGTRTLTRVTDGYYELLADSAFGALQPPYGQSFPQ